MMNRLFWLTSVLLIVCIGWSPSFAQDGENLLENGGLEDGVLAPWTSYGGAGAAIEIVQELTGAAVPEGPIEGAYALRVSVDSPGANFWDAGVQNRSFPLFEQGKSYTLSAFLKAESGEMQINFKPEHDGNPYTGYGEQQFTFTEEWAEYSITTPPMPAGGVNPAAITFHVQFAPGVFYMDAVRWYEGDYVPPVFRKRVGATDPSPAESVLDVARDAELGWVAGVFANTHNVYFGANFADVNAASVANPMGVLASEGQSEARFQPPDILDFSQTYYWRVDEVNAAPDQTVYPGPVWAFTTEAFSDPITPSAVTASSSFTAGMEPDGIIDGSGLDAADQHNIIATDMWLSAPTDSAPWVQFEFDKAYRLHEMWVWNSNQGIETVIGFGSQDVVVEISMDGENWTALDGVPPFAQATGVSNYTHNTTVDFGEAVARFVRLSITSGWGPLPQVGLSEVRFLHIPTYAREPQPADGSTTDGVDVTLAWRKGRGASSHQVVLSTDMAQVDDNSAVAGTPTDNSFAAPDLSYASTYYWRINEIDETSVPSTFEGDIWSFTTPEYRSVDDFEIYHDEEFFEIWSVWIDGFGDEANNGAIVGNGNEAERGVVQEGRQSMPIRYDNGTAAVSEVTRTFDQTQDWTRSGIQTLVLYFKQGVDNTGGGQVYVKINDTKVAYEGGADLPPGWDAWTQWNIDLSAIADAASVRSLTIGVEGAGAMGVLYVDSIRLYKNAPTVFQPLSWFEAESGAITAPMQVFSDSPTASAGQHIGTADGIGDENNNPPADGVATYSFDVPEDGVYRLAIRVIITGGSNSFWFRIPGMATNTTNHASGWVRFNDISDGATWHWDEVHSSDDGNSVVEFTLSAGTHTLEIARREDGTLLDAIAVLQ
ncbi:MAG: carbohydrate binding domain-containing protein [Planctomycetes bacterium]|nr:carbohydrate binding domain-containing protein [Planctomycetota bacterium]